MLPLAPGLFSTTTAWPRPSASFWPRRRHSTSLEPPGGNGAMKRRGFDGKLCAVARVAQVKIVMSAASLAMERPPSGSNFIRQIVEADLAAGKYGSVRTRFPPEPNGYLHFGHAKSICLNFGLAQQYGGACHLRFDDTNPTKEEQEYVDAIRDAVKWLGFDWGAHGEHASGYFSKLFEMAEALVRHGHAYVDSQSVEETKATRGSFTEHGIESPYRNRSAEESLKLLREMRDGQHPDGSHVL